MIAMIITFAKYPSAAYMLLRMYEKERDKTRREIVVVEVED